jgi:hypothetical protein
MIDPRERPAAGSRRFLPAIPALLAAPVAWLGFLSGSPALLPVLATASVYPVFARLVTSGRRGAAVAAALSWAAAYAATTTFLTFHDPARAGGVILNGPAYRDEMFAFIAAGAGRESDPTAFVPQHAWHLGLFVVLSLATGGLLGLAMGAVLLAYMSFYVGALMNGAAPGLAAAFGWPPWAVARVVGFVLLGALLSRPLLSRLSRRPVPAAGEGRLYLVAALLLAADVLLKWLLAPSWASLLRPCLPG